MDPPFDDGKIDDEQTWPALVSTAKSEHAVIDSATTAKKITEMDVFDFETITESFTAISVNQTLLSPNISPQNDIQTGSSLDAFFYVRLARSYCERDVRLDVGASFDFIEDDFFSRQRILWINGKKCLLFATKLVLNQPI